MRCLALLVLPAVGLSLTAGQARAAEVTIVTDRPSVTNSSVVVPQGVFQMENGILASDVGYGAIVDLPESNIRYGMLPRTELHSTLPDYFYSLT